MDDLIHLAFGHLLVLLVVEDARIVDGSLVNQIEEDFGLRRSARYSFHELFVQVDLHEGRLEISTLVSSSNHLRISSLQVLCYSLLVDHLELLRREESQIDLPCCWFGDRFEGVFAFVRKGMGIDDFSEGQVEILLIVLPQEFRPGVIEFLGALLEEGYFTEMRGVA